MSNSGKYIDLWKQLDEVIEEGKRDLKWTKILTSQQTKNDVIDWEMEKITMFIRLIKHDPHIINNFDIEKDLGELMLFCYLIGKNLTK